MIKYYGGYLSNEDDDYHIDKDHIDCECYRALGCDEYCNCDPDCDCIRCVRCAERYLAT